MSSIRNGVGENVYIRDETYEWLPAIITEYDPENDRVLVETKLPKSWKDHTILVSDDSVSEDALNQHKWVRLSDYPGNKLPRRSDIIVRNMADIPHLHEATILYQVKERHAQQKPYTRVGEIVVAVNPCQWIPDLYSEETQKAYASNLIWNRKQPVEVGRSSNEEKKDDDELGISARPTHTGFGGVYDRLGYEPHIYEVSALAYRGLLEDGKDQAIFVSGESGAGKTETVKIVLKHLARLPEWKSTYSGADRSSPHAMVDSILESIPIFEAFGNAKTRRNYNSSRFAKVTSLYFSEDGDKQKCFLTGTFTEAHLLEKSRVVSQCSDERNFHIFYQMLSASDEEKEELLGAGWQDAAPRDFRYLVTGSDETGHQSDHKDWQSTLHALKSFGWKGDELKSLVQALGILLRLGNITFSGTSAGDAVVENGNELHLLSKSLGVSAAALEKAMVSRRIKAMDDEVDVPLPASQAKECCDGLAKIIYSRLFGVLVDSINEQTYSGNDSESRVISLLDMFGFESFETNGFDQLCVNYSNEKLQQKYVHDNIFRLTKEYRDEGITLFDFDSVDNTRTVALFESPSGIVTALDDECLRPNGTNESFVFKLKGTSSALIENNLHARTEFSIQHYAGPVAYDAGGFIERNSDKLPRDIILVASNSSNKFIRIELLNLIKEEEDALKTRKKKTSIMYKFQVQLRSLLNNMRDMQVRYIRCIKPNDCLAPIRLDHVKTLQQIKCAGLVTAIEMGRKSFPDKLPFSLIEERFSCLISSDYHSMLKDIPLHDRACLMMTFIFANSVETFDDEELGLPYACGKTKVYFRAGAVEYLETLRRELFSYKSRILQSWYRSKRELRKYALLRRSIVTIQSYHRSRKARLQYWTLKRGILRLQAVFFSRRAQACYAKTQSAAVAIQKWCRLFLARRDATIRVQSCFRRIKAKSHLTRQLKALVIVQTQLRAHIAWKKVDRRKRAAVALTSFARMTLARDRYRKACKAARAAECIASESLEPKALVSKAEPSRDQFEGKLEPCPEVEIEHKLYVKDHDTLDSRDGVCAELNHSESAVCRYCKQLRYDDTSVNRQRIRDLRQEIVHVTEAAELHNRLVEAEFEERISDYETEVLQLQKNVAFLEAEKDALKTQINTAQINYTKTIKLLQRGMRDTTDSHKEYLAKIMFQLERSNEHRKAETARFSEELRNMKTSSDAKIRCLETENHKLRTALDEHERLRQMVFEKADVLQEVNRFSRKIEKLVSPQQILLAIDSASDAGQRYAIIEKNISTKCRKTLYHLEDLITYTVDIKPCFATEAEIIGLQNQLVRAYEDNEQLREEIALLRSADAPCEGQKRH